MKISLIDYTGSGHTDPFYAARLLLFAKQTRLKMSADGFTDVMNMPEEFLKKELKYIAGTIPSAWEFVNYTFLLEGVSRAFTHQLVRTRTASFAQQTMRILDVDGYDVVTSPKIENYPAAMNEWEWCHSKIEKSYRKLIDELGVPIEDARGILPTNICTNILVSMNLRTLSEMAMKRLNLRVQGEYRDVLFSMCERVLDTHPWAEDFISVAQADVLVEMDKTMKDCGLDQDQRIAMQKLVDRVRTIDCKRELEQDES